MTTAIQSPPRGLSYTSGILLVLLAGVFWSSIGIVIRLMDGADAWQILFYRSLSLTIFLFAVLAIRTRGLPVRVFREAGADCVFVPGVRAAPAIAALVNEIDAPVNILAGAPSPPVPQLQELGVARVSIGGLLSLAAATMFRRAAHELKETGTYSFANDIILHPEMNGLMR